MGVWVSRRSEPMGSRQSGADACSSAAPTARSTRSTPKPDAYAGRSRQARRAHRDQRRQEAVARGRLFGNQRARPMRSTPRPDSCCGSAGSTSIRRPSSPARRRLLMACSTCRSPRSKKRWRPIRRYPCCTFRGLIAALNAGDRRDHVAGLHLTSGASPAYQFDGRAVVRAVRRRDLVRANARPQGQRALRDYR